MPTAALAPNDSRMNREKGATMRGRISGAVEPGFPNVPRLDTFVLPAAGHNMNWALNATDWFAHAIGWSDLVVGK